jgi:hypothetical protein
MEEADTEPESLKQPEYTRVHEKKKSKQALLLTKAAAHRKT